MLLEVVQSRDIEEATHQMICQFIDTQAATKCWEEALHWINVCNQCIHDTDPCIHDTDPCDSISGQINERNDFRLCTICYGRHNRDGFSLAMEKYKKMSDAKVLSMDSNRCQKIITCQTYWLAKIMGIHGQMLR